MYFSADEGDDEWSWGYNEGKGARKGKNGDKGWKGKGEGKGKGDKGWKGKDDEGKPPKPPNQKASKAAKLAAQKISGKRADHSGFLSRKRMRPIISDAMKSGGSLLV